MGVRNSIGACWQGPDAAVYHASPAGPPRPLVPPAGLV